MAKSTAINPAARIAATAATLTSLMTQAASPATRATLRDCLLNLKIVEKQFAALQETNENLRLALKSARQTEKDAQDADNPR